jgi:transposase-like protein
LSQQTRKTGNTYKKIRKVIQMRVYDREFKEEAIKLSYEIGNKAASEQLGIPVTTLYT